MLNTSTATSGSRLCRPSFASGQGASESECSASISVDGTIASPSVYPSGLHALLHMSACTASCASSHAPLMHASRMKYPRCSTQLLVCRLVTVGGMMAPVPNPDAPIPEAEAMKSVEPDRVQVAYLPGRGPVRGRVR